MVEVVLEDVDRQLQVLLDAEDAEKFSYSLRLWERKCVFKLIRLTLCITWRKIRLGGFFCVAEYLMIQHIDKVFSLVTACFPVL